MNAVVTAVTRLIVHRDGQDLIEYGVLVALIAVVALVAVTTVGNVVNAVFWETFANAL